MTEYLAIWIGLLIHDGATEPHRVGSTPLARWIGTAVWALLMLALFRGAVWVFGLASGVL